MRLPNLPTLGLAGTILVDGVATAQAQAMAPPVTTPGPVTIDQSDLYSSQRPCARKCWDSYGTIGYQIANRISCEMKPNVRNECFCRTDLQFSAHTFVGSCVSTWCSKVAADIATATRLYDEYCTANGYVQAGPPETTVGSGTFFLSHLKNSHSPCRFAHRKQRANHAGRDSILYDMPLIISQAYIDPWNSGNQPASTTGTRAVNPASRVSTSSSRAAVTGPNEAEQTASEPGNGAGGGGGGTQLGAGELAGIVIGAISAVATIAGVIYARRTLRNRHKN
ncbi:hypothetical protein PG985_005566 [Apiospora marii]|uniref:uncharacterized protein n=1 Tax=Apiospora marii TaxID=335849 RepID=UPI0031300343